MPVMLGAFETSLRSGSGGQDVKGPSLHKGCSGHSHGHCVKKERPSRDHLVMSRSCSLTPAPWDQATTSSSDDNEMQQRDQVWSSKPIFSLFWFLVVCYTRQIIIGEWNDTV